MKYTGCIFELDLRAAYYNNIKYIGCIFELDLLAAD
jgi:hypothetical protein